MSGILKLSASHFLHCLFEAEESQPKDFKLVAGNGSEIPCHGRVLAAQSPTFKAMVNPVGAMKENDLKRIEMKAFLGAALKTFVRYIYCQKVPLKEMDCNTALELFRLGHMYLIRDLTENVSKMMLTKNEAWWSPNCVLELYFLVRNMNVFPELTDHAVEIILKMPEDDLRQCERYKELDSKEVTELLWIFLRKLKTG